MSLEEGVDNVHDAITPTPNSHPIVDVELEEEIYLSRAEHLKSIRFIQGNISIRSITR